MNTLLDAAAGRGVVALEPDVLVYQTLEDTLKGKDTLADWCLAAPDQKLVPAVHDNAPLTRGRFIGQLYEAAGSPDVEIGEELPFKDSFGIEWYLPAMAWAKEQGISQVIAKAYDEKQGKILTKIGADKIVYPEKEIGVQLANDLAFNNMFDTIELSSEYSIGEIITPTDWIGKDLRTLKLREKYGINAIAVKRGGQLLVNPPADQPTKKDDVFMLLGTNSTLKKIASANAPRKN